MKLKLVIGTTLLTGMLAMTSVAMAQQHQRPMTLAEYTGGTASYISPKGIKHLAWLGNEYILERDNKLLINSLKGEERVLLSLEDLRGALNAPELLHIPSFRVVSNELGQLLRFSWKGKDFYINPLNKQVRFSFGIQGSVEAKAYNPNLTHVAIVRNDNIEIHPTRTREAVQTITSDGSKQIVYGQSVHQNEFGIDGGLFWSPDGKKLAFYRMDQSMVTPSPILHVNARHPYAETQYYPMAGTPSHQVTVGVFDLETRETIYLQTGEPADKYLTNITWSPDSKEIFIAEVNRAQTDCELNAYDPNTGAKRRTLFTEHNDKYIEPQHPLTFLPSSNKEFIWQSRRDGWLHLYLYNTEGHLIRQITKGSREVTELLGFADGGKSVIYQVTEQDALERHYYRQGLSSSKPIRITQTPGWHRAQLSADGSALLVRYSSTTEANTIELRQTQSGKVSKVLHRAENPDKDYLQPEITLGKLTSADGKTSLNYRLIKPYNFDKTKKYPAIIYVYNGPHAQLVENSHRSGARGWELNMANEGYILLTVDGRGSANRGADFEQVIHRQLGKHEMADQLQGVELLRSLGYVDMDRLGVYGWSYGGFMTTNLMLTYPKIFKVGVAGGPVMDWSRYEVMYGERYMDTPQENETGYQANNLLLRAGELKGRLLLIHGTIDPVVIWQHSLLFVKSAVSAGSHPDYMVYPEHPHNVLGQDRLHLNETITRYFKDHL